MPDRSSPSTDLLTAEGITKADYSRELDKNFDYLNSSESKTWFEGMLSDFLALTLRIDRSETFYVTADRGYRYLLKQPKVVFNKLVAKDDTKKWLEEGYYDNQKTWFVIGWRTFVNAKLHRGKHKAAGVSGQVKAPVAQAAGDLSGKTDAQVKGGHESSAEASGGTQTMGERIYAICYRKVNVAFKKGQIEAKLENGNVWKSFSAKRGHTEMEIEYLEAELDDTDNLDGYKVTNGGVPEGSDVFGIPPELQ